MSNRNIFREQTRLFPRNKSRAAWVQRERIAPHTTENGKWVEFEYEVFEDISELTRQNGRPFLIVNHKAQIRETHQRIVRGPTGGLMHVTAGEVLDVVTFKKSDPRFRVYGPGWVDQDGVTWTPFVFPVAPWADGQDEELDPQWVRETYTLPLLTQVAACKKRRIDRAEYKREFGDKRGTTLNLEVSAGADDSERVVSPSLWTNDHNSHTVGNIFGDFYSVQCRYTIVTIPAGATINSAVVVCHSSSNRSGTAMLTNVYFEAADNPGQVTSWNDFTNRLPTTAIAWDNIPGWSVGEEGADTTTPDMSATLQEVIDRAGWASGQALNWFWVNDGSGSSADRRFTTYEGNTAETPRLDIDYTEATVTPTITDVTSTTVQDGTEIVVTGTDFQSPQATGKIEIGDNATYASANLEEATVSAWADTEITAAVVQGALSAGSVWVFVTNDDGNVSSGFEITLEEASSSVGAIASRSGQSVGVRLEQIYASIGGHQAPPTARFEYWLLGRIGQLRGLNLTSGYKSREDHLIILYENLTGNSYIGNRHSTEMILRAIEEAL